MSQAKMFYVRFMLNHVRGATCFTDVRTVNGVVHDSYKDTCDTLVYYLIMESMLVVLQRQVSKEKQISYAIFLRCHLCHTSYQRLMTFGGRHGNSYQRIFCINISRIPRMQVIFFYKTTLF